jgi:hypothetical protein
MSSAILKIKGDQTANIKKIDNLMVKFNQWEKGYGNKKDYLKSLNNKEKYYFIFLRFAFELHSAF